MFDIKNTNSLYFIQNKVDNSLYLSNREYGKFVGKSESTIRKKLKDNPEIAKVNIKGIIYKLIPVEICLQLLVTDKPEKINIFIQDVFDITGVHLEFPDFTNIKSKTNTSKTDYSPSGFIYVFESSLSLLKVGFTKNIKNRLKQLQRWDGELTIVDVIQATIYKEKNLHKLLHATGDYFGDEWYPINRKTEITTIIENMSER